jgi:hypothetical protein
VEGNNRSESLDFRPFRSDYSGRFLSSASAHGGSAKAEFEYTTRGPAMTIELEPELVNRKSRFPGMAKLVATNLTYLRFRRRRHFQKITNFTTS